MAFTAATTADDPAPMVARPYPVELIAPVLLAVLAETSRALEANPGMKEHGGELVALFLRSLRI